MTDTEPAGGQPSTAYDDAIRSVQAGLQSAASWFPALGRLPAVGCFSLQGLATDLTTAARRVIIPAARAQVAEQIRGQSEHRARLQLFASPQAAWRAGLEFAASIADRPADDDTEPPVQREAPEARCGRFGHADVGDGTCWCGQVVWVPTVQPGHGGTG